MTTLWQHCKNIGQCYVKCGWQSSQVSACHYLSKYCNHCRKLWFQKCAQILTSVFTANMQDEDEVQSDDKVSELLAAAGIGFAPGSHRRKSPDITCHFLHLQIIHKIMQSNLSTMWYSTIVTSVSHIHKTVLNQWTILGEVSWSKEFSLLLAVLVLTDCWFQTVGAAMEKAWPHEMQIK